MTPYTDGSLVQGPYPWTQQVFNPSPMPPSDQSCAFNSNVHASIDVEDLAKVFSNGLNRHSEPKIQHSRHHRVFRGNFNQISRSPYQQVQRDFNCRSDCSDFCPIYENYSNCGDFNGGLPHGFGIPCTEAQWLACPVNNCPVFEQGTGNWNLTPAYPNQRLDGTEFYRDDYRNYCPLRDDEDIQSLEDYL